jgi:hypothetical protein
MDQEDSLMEQHLLVTIERVVRTVEAAGFEEYHRTDRKSKCQSNEFNLVLC